MTAAHQGTFSRFAVVPPPTIPSTHFQVSSGGSASLLANAQPMPAPPALTLRDARISAEVAQARANWASEMQRLRQHVTSSYTLSMPTLPDLTKYESLGGLVHQLSYGDRTFRLAQPLKTCCVIEGKRVGLVNVTGE